MIIKRLNEFVRYGITDIVLHYGLIEGIIVVGTHGPHQKVDQRIGGMSGEVGTGIVPEGRVVACREILVVQPAFNVLITIGDVVRSYGAIRPAAHIHKEDPILGIGSGTEGIQVEVAAVHVFLVTKEGIGTVV